MIQEGVISESALKEPIDDDFIKTLPDSLQTYLRDNKITLHQLMTHQAGLGDYLGKYVSAISGALEIGAAPPKINQPHDFLKFAEDKTFPIGKEHYSNLGILLVGLAIKTAYEKQYGSYNYDEILHRYIIDDANMSCFFSSMPEGSRYNPEDKIAPHIAGGPAGGYWTTAEDLAKFGKWIYEKCIADEKDPSDRPKLKKLIEKYGQEFYHPKQQCVAHGGAIPTSSAFLRVSLATGSIIAVLSDQPQIAFHLQEKIRENILSSPAPTITSVSMSNYPLASQNNMSVTAKSDIPIDDIKEAPDPDSIPPAFRKKH